MKPIETKERFMRHVSITNSCWLWTGQINRDGYGVFSPGNKRAHRMSYQLFNGPVDTNFFVLHKCDVRNCVNPAHLFLGTAADNVRDKILKNRSNNIRGEKVKGSKLTEKQVLEIRNANEDWIILATRYGVSVWTINNIKTHKTWTWVGGPKNLNAGGTPPPPDGLPT